MHDSTTMLIAKPAFESRVQFAFESEDLIRPLVVSVQECVVNVTPQIDDWSCPVCLQVAYKPIHLRCGMISLSKQKHSKCAKIFGRAYILCRMHSKVTAEKSGTMPPMSRTERCQLSNCGEFGYVY